MEFVQGREAKSPQRKKPSLNICPRVKSFSKPKLLSPDPNIGGRGGPFSVEGPSTRSNTFVALAYVERRLDSKKPVYVCLLLGEV